MTSDRKVGESEPLPSNANDFIEQQLDHRIAAIESVYGADALTVYGPLLRGLDDLLRQAIETKRKEDTPRRRKAIVVLTTVGGYIGVVHRMVDTLRHHYETVEFVVPNYAYSAGQFSPCQAIRSIWTITLGLVQLTRKLRLQMDQSCFQPSDILSGTTT